MTADVETLRSWIQACLVLAGVCSTTFPLLYLFTSWSNHRLGWGIMVQSISFAVVLDLTALFSFWRPNNVLVLFWIHVVVFTFIAGASAYLTWLLWELNYKKQFFKLLNSRRRTMTENNPKHLAGETNGDYASPLRQPAISNKMYDVLKYVALIFLPALGTLYFALASIWGLPFANEVVGSITAFDTFLGLLLRLSTKSYNNSDARFDGTMAIADNGDGTGMVNMGFKTHPAEVPHKKEFVLKVENHNN